MTEIVLFFRSELAFSLSSVGGGVPPFKIQSTFPAELRKFGATTFRYKQSPLTKIINDLNPYFC